MEITLTEVNGIAIAEITADQLRINSPQKALQLLVDCKYHGAEAIILREKHFVPDFFELQTGLAGEILQKFSTYRTKLAIVGDFSKYESKSLRDFIYESNKVGRINFVPTVREALDVLGRNN